MSSDILLEILVLSFSFLLFLTALFLIEFFISPNATQAYIFAMMICSIHSFFYLVIIYRYLRRGVNEKGRVANDVETEQIVFEDVPEGLPVQLSSVVQNRGSIPLFWSQETSRLNLKPDIICMFPFHEYCNPCNDIFFVIFYTFMR